MMGQGVLVVIEGLLHLLEVGREVLELRGGLIGEVVQGPVHLLHTLL